MNLIDVVDAPVGAGGLTAAIFVIVVMAKLVEVLAMAIVNKISPTKEERWSLEDRKSVNEIKDLTKSLHEMHYKFDADGTPIWYVPRSWDQTQREIHQSIVQVTHTQESMSKVLERMVTVLDRMDRRQEQALDQMKRRGN